MAFLDESGLQRFWENIVSKFVRKVDGKDLSSNDYTDEDKTYIESLKEDYLGTFAGKTIAELQAALETWLESNLVVNATTYIGATEESLVDGWNSKDTSSVLADGPRWFFTVMAVYSNANYVNLRISSYNSQNVYSVIRQNGTWRSILKLAYVNDISHKDTDITWSNTNLVEKVSLIDFASSNLHNANRFAFANPAGIKVEHSTDGGATYFEPSVANYPERKVKLVSGILEGNGGSFRIGDPAVANARASVQDKLRITLNAPSMGIYTHLKKLLLNISTEGANGCKVTLETSIANSPDVYTTKGTYSLKGWTGWNSIPADFRFGSGTNIGNIRLTFEIESLSSNESFKCYLTVYNIVALGETAWSIPSTMGKTGHLYNYDYQQNATFPANITATKFIGDGSGLTNLPVSFTQNLTSGEKIGTININGTNTDIFAPEGSDGGNIYGVHDGEGNVTLMIGDAETEATTITPEIIGAADRNHTHNNMTGATTSKAGTSGFVPAPAAGTENRFLRADGTWQEVTIPEGGGTVSGDYLPLAGGTVTGNVAITATTASTSTTTGALKVSGGVGVAGDVYANAVVGAVWNDYAETRRAYSEDFKYMKPGCVVTECPIENDTVRLTDKRLEKIPMVITDTYGFLIGEKEGDVVPVAVAGRVLVNTYEDRSKFELGDAVCSGPNGTVSIMTYEELLTFPDRVLGYVSCIPDYDTWGEVKVNNRIWIKVK